MSKRGEYRSIEVGQLDQPTFQALSGEAQHLYLVLLLILGPLRIKVAYDDAIRGRWGNRSQEELDATRQELLKAGWLRSEERIHYLPRAIDCNFKPKTNDNHAKNARLLLGNLRGSALADELANELGLELDADPPPVNSLSDSPSHSLSAQDKTKQHKSKTNTPSLRDGAYENRKRDWGWTEPIAGAIRTRWWLGEDPPEKAPPSWSMEAELRRFKVWCDADVDLDEMLRFIEGGALRRDNGDLPGVQIGEGVTGARFAYQSTHDPESEYNKNITAYWTAQEKDDRQKRGSEPAHISQALNPERKGPRSFQPLAAESTRIPAGTRPSK